MVREIEEEFETTVAGADSKFAILQVCAAVCCSVLQCAAVCCSVLPCVAVCCSAGADSKFAILQVCDAVCCSVLQCVAVPVLIPSLPFFRCRMCVCHYNTLHHISNSSKHYNTLHHTTSRLPFFRVFRGLQGVAGCCRVLQGAAG